MDDTLCQCFFREPSSPLQRQYEALRAVFLDKRPQKEVASHFGYSYAAFRQLVHQFRQCCASGTPPPFSSSRASVGQPHRGPRRSRPGRNCRPLPTPEP